MFASSLPTLLLGFVLLLAQCAETGTRHGTPNACGGHCPASAPVCDDASATCVECLGAADCGGARPNCDLLTHACFGCDVDADCVDPELPRCESASHACAPCTADADCAERAATPVCDEATGRCGACTADTEVARCGATSCDRQDLVCTSTPRTSVVRCGPCQADSECEADHVCVRRTQGATELGSYCLPLRPAAGCGNSLSNAAFLPYSYAHDLLSVDGLSVTVCAPRDTISCEALAHFGDGCSPPPSGTANDACGLPLLHDGHCYTPLGSAPKCSYACLDSADCRSGLACASAPIGTATICR